MARHGSLRSAPTVDLVAGKVPVPLQKIIISNYFLLTDRFIETAISFRIALEKKKVTEMRASAS